MVYTTKIERRDRLTVPDRGRWRIAKDGGVDMGCPSCGELLHMATPDIEDTGEDGESIASFFCRNIDCRLHGQAQFVGFHPFLNIDLLKEHP